MKPIHSTLRHFAMSMAVVGALGACTTISKVETGEALVGDRLSVSVNAPWNRFASGMGANVPTWTLEGFSVDSLRFYVGIKDGALIAPTPSGGKGVAPLTFKASMQAAEVVALYQGLLTRDGSTFTLDKLQATTFVGAPGFKFEYQMVRKHDEVPMRGVAWGAVRNGELFVINYLAPRLHFFAKQVAQVEALAQSAKVKG